MDALKEFIDKDRLSAGVVREEDGVTRYLNHIKKFPFLEAEEEQRLVQRWKEKGDRAAAERLLTSYLRLVAKIARRYRGYGLPLSDLISEGTLGLMQAMDKFDPAKGSRLSTYAVWWIRASIKDYILRSWSMVRLGRTNGQKKLFFGLRSLKRSLEKTHLSNLETEDIQTIAQHFHVRPQEVIDMEQRLAAPDASLNITFNAETDLEWQDSLEDERANQEEDLLEKDELDKRRALLAQGLRCLSPREYEFLYSRRLSETPRTLAEISEDYGLSRERIRQIEAHAFAKLQHAVKRNAHEGPIKRSIIPSNKHYREFGSVIENAFHL